MKNFLFSLFCLVSVSTSASNWYLCDSATGNQTGTDWNNAWSGTGRINWSNIKAGDTIWFAGGTYNPFNMGATGRADARLYLKRARASDPECSQAAGWQSRFDSQVIISVAISNGSAGIWIVPPYADYITIDGQVPNGIKFPLKASSGIVNNGIISVGNNNILRYIEVAGNGEISGNTGFRIGNDYQYGAKTNALVEFCYVHDCSNGLAVNGTDRVVIRNCEFARNYGDNANHDNICYVFGGANNGKFLNNYVHEFGAMGLYFAPLSWVCDGWEIIGNVFKNPTGSSSGQALAFDPGGFPNSSQYQFGKNWKIYHNTIVNVRVAINNGSRWGESSTTGGDVQNNIFWNTSLMAGAFNLSNNFDSSSVFSPFVSIPDNLHLIRELPGVNLGAPPDRDGFIRNTPDKGAYEFAGIPGVPPGPTPVPDPIPVPIPDTNIQTNILGLNFEAESGTITYPFIISTFNNKTGIVQQIGETTINSGGTAIYNFNVLSNGNYYIRLTYSASSDGHNSFFVAVDTEPVSPYNICDVKPTAGAWGTAFVSFRGNGTDVIPQYTNKVFNLSAGQHKLIVKGREPTYLDKIEVIPTINSEPLPLPIPLPNLTNNFGDAYLTIHTNIDVTFPIGLTNTNYLNWVFTGSATGKFYIAPGKVTFTNFRGNGTVQLLYLGNNAIRSEVVKISKSNNTITINMKNGVVTVVK